MATDFDIPAGMIWLAANDPDMARVIAVTGEPPSRHRAGGFATLLQIIVEQQVSTASARAIWSRVAEAGATTVEYVHQASPEDLQALGLSRPKVRYAKALAEECACGALDFEKLEEMVGDDAHARLLAIKGIGRWSAEIYRMFALGDQDIWPSGDIALQEGVRRACGLDVRPVGEELDALASRWSPWRSVAALLMWRYYHLTGGPGGEKGGDSKSAKKT